MSQGDVEYEDTTKVGYDGRRRWVPERLETVRMLADQIEDRLKALDERLAPVLGPDETLTEVRARDEPEPSQAPLADQIMRLEHVLQRVLAHENALLSRLEI